MSEIPPLRTIICDPEVLEAWSTSENCRLAVKFARRLLDNHAPDHPLTNLAREYLRAAGEPLVEADANRSPLEHVWV